MSTHINTAASLVVIALDQQRYGLPLACVVQVIMSVAVTPVPASPPQVMGVINVHGEVLAVVAGRRWFSLPPRPLSLSDHFLITHTDQRKAVLVVDRVLGLQPPPTPAELASAVAIAGVGALTGVVQTASGLILIPRLEDLAMFARQTSQALTAAAAAPQVASHD